MLSHSWPTDRDRDYVLQENVVTLEDFQAMCRHNDYLHDTESTCNCTAQVCGDAGRHCLRCKVVRVRVRVWPTDELGAGVHSLQSDCLPMRPFPFFWDGYK